MVLEIQSSMDDIQFIIESPNQQERGRRRLRSITSCDTWYVARVTFVPFVLTDFQSRWKKIRCEPPKSGEDMCGACKSANIQCRFRDRARYLAERSRAIAGKASGDTPQLSYQPRPHSNLLYEDNSGHVSQRFAFF